MVKLLVAVIAVAAVLAFVNRATEWRQCRFAFPILLVLLTLLRLILLWSLLCGIVPKRERGREREGYRIAFTSCYLPADGVPVR